MRALARATSSQEASSSSSAASAAGGTGRRGALLRLGVGAAPLAAPLTARAAEGAAPVPTAVVVGACGGIGGALAARLTADGYAVVPCCRSAAATAAAAARLGGAAIDAGAGADLASVTSARAFAGALRAAGVDSVDALVFASGVVSAPLSAGRTVEGYDLNVGVNAVGPLALALGALDLVRAARGRVVLVGSTAALDVPPSTAFLDDLAYNTSRPHAPRAAYAESKALGVLLVDELARREEELGTGVTANVIHPGPAATLAVRYELPARYEQRLGMSEEQLAQQVRARACERVVRVARVCACVHAHSHAPHPPARARARARAHAHTHTIRRGAWACAPPTRPPRAPSGLRRRPRRPARRASSSSTQACRCPPSTRRPGARPRRRGGRGTSSRACVGGCRHPRNNALAALMRRPPPTRACARVRVPRARALRAMHLTAAAGAAVRPRVYDRAIMHGRAHTSIHTARAYAV